MEFLFRVYADSRADELAIVPWNAEQKNAFLRMQFSAQHAHYQKYYGAGAFDIVLQDGVPVGRLYIHRTATTIEVIDIALLREHQRKGIGRALLTALLAEASANAQCVELYVEQNNLALHLYTRLGFVQTGTHGIYCSMRWQKQALQHAAARPDSQGVIA